MSERLFLVEVLKLLRGLMRRIQARVDDLT